jgi:hypothetical protein
MTVLIAMLNSREQLTTVPCRGGSRVGKAKNKNQQRLAGALLLYSDYFAEDATNTPKEFRRCVRMNKEIFMKIVFGVREYGVFDDFLY